MSVYLRNKRFYHVLLWSFSLCALQILQNHSMSGFSLGVHNWRRHLSWFGLVWLTGMTGYAIFLRNRRFSLGSSLRNGTNTEVCSVSLFMPGRNELKLAGLASMFCLVLLAQNYEIRVLTLKTSSFYRVKYSKFQRKTAMFSSALSAWKKEVQIVWGDADIVSLFYPIKPTRILSFFKISVIL